jgi:hypothetical protein
MQKNHQPKLPSGRTSCLTCLLFSAGTSDKVPDALRDSAVFALLSNTAAYQMSVDQAVRSLCAQRHSTYSNPITCSGNKGNSAKQCTKLHRLFQELKTIHYIGSDIFLPLPKQALSTRHPVLLCPSPLFTPLTWVPHVEVQLAWCPTNKALSSCLLQNHQQHHPNTDQACARTPTSETLSVPREASKPPSGTTCRSCAACVQAIQ